MLQIVYIYISTSFIPKKNATIFLNAKDSPKLPQIYKNYPIYHAFLEIKHTFLTKNNFVRDFFSNFAEIIVANNKCVSHKTPYYDAHHNTLLKYDFRSKKCL